MRYNDPTETTQNKKDSDLWLCKDVLLLMAAWLKLSEFNTLILVNQETYKLFNDNEIVWKSMLENLTKMKASAWRKLIEENPQATYKSECKKVVTKFFPLLHFYSNDLKLKKGKISLFEAIRFRNSVLETRDKFSQFSQDPLAFFRSFFLFIMGLREMVGDSHKYTEIVEKLSKRHGQVAILEKSRKLLNSYLSVFTFRVSPVILVSGSNTNMPIDIGFCVKLLVFCAMFNKKGTIQMTLKGGDMYHSVWKKAEKLVDEFVCSHNPKLGL